MIHDYGISAAHNAGIAASELKCYVREMSDDESPILPETLDLVGLGTLAKLAEVLADGLGRYNQMTNHYVEEGSV